MNRRWIGITLLVLLVAIQGAWAEQRWLHVRVHESDDGDRVSVNVPLDMIETLLPLIDADELRDGKLYVPDDELEGIDLREIAAALRDMGDATFFTVQSEDESVRVTKEGDFLMVRVEEKGASGEQVRVRLPLAVFEALVGENPHELDVLAALRVLREFDGEDLIRVESNDELVRIWIDSSEDGI